MPSHVRRHLTAAALALAWAGGVVLVNRLSGRVPGATWADILAPLLGLAGLAWGALLALRRLQRAAAARPDDPYFVRHLGLVWAVPMIGMRVANEVPLSLRTPVAVTIAALLAQTTLAAPFALWAGVWFQWVLGRSSGRPTTTGSQ